MDKERVRTLLLRYNLTDFETKVLMRTFDIPKGKTVSYKQLAASCGRPGAYRAVGNIMHKNPLPLIIPCHRVVASGRKIGGYAYGTRMKKLLLKSEGATA